MLQFFVTWALRHAACILRFGHLLYIGSKIWSDILKNLKSVLPYSFREQYKNDMLSYQQPCSFLFHMLVTFL